ncbi:MAG TPA: hypothetical protein VLU98_04140 [Methanomicrobiales archaeon]|nr:hypothetical protein [Methanomicrobiales archaeon]
MTEGSPLRNRLHLWLLVPVLAWGGILAEVVLPVAPPFLSFGAYGCVLGSAAIAALAFLKKRKDIVSLCVPIFALIIFITPPETRPGLVMEAVYAATLTALLIRLEKRFT